VAGLRFRFLRAHGFLECAHEDGLRTSRKSNIQTGILPWFFLYSLTHRFREQLKLRSVDTWIKTE
jgi:hypothetical protein